MACTLGILSTFWMHSGLETGVRTLDTRCVYVDVHVCACVYVCTIVCLQMCVYANVCVYKCVCKCVYVLLCVDKCMYRVCVCG